MHAITALGYNASMASNDDYIALPNSERPPLPGATRVADIDAGEIVDVTVRLHPRVAEPSAEETNSLSLKALQERHYPSRQEYAAKYPASPESISNVEAFAKAHALQVLAVSATERSLTLRGPAKAMSAAFHVTLGRYETAEGSYRGFTGQIQIPLNLSSIIEGVTGLDNRQYANSRD